MEPRGLGLLSRQTMCLTVIRIVSAPMALRLSFLLATAQLLEHFHTQTRLTTQLLAVQPLARFLR